MNGRDAMDECPRCGSAEWVEGDSCSNCRAALDRADENAADELRALLIAWAADDN